MNNILWKCSSHFNFRSQKRLYKNVKTCDMTAKCMMHVTCCWSIEKKKGKKILGTSQYLSWGGGRGMEEDLRGGSKSFQEEQKEDQTSPTEYKVGGYWKLTAGEPPLRGDFIVTQTKSSSSQGINITGRKERKRKNWLINYWVTLVSWRRQQFLSWQAAPLLGQGRWNQDTHDCRGSKGVIRVENITPLWKTVSSC